MHYCQVGVDCGGNRLGARVGRDGDVYGERGMDAGGHNAIAMQTCKRYRG